MPSTLEMQVKELKDAGYKVKTGIRQFSQNEKKNRTLAGNMWLHRWAKHAAQNYPIVSRSDGVSFLAGAALNVPAFIVGIGPSLDKNIKDIKSVRGRALVLASDAALRPLMANGIVPDLVMSYDCQAEQATMWETLDTTPIPLICSSTSHPKTIDAWKGSILFYNQWHTKDDFVQTLLPYIYPHIGRLPSAGTVGSMLIILAKHMGCDPILTVGMDLCYEKLDKGWRYRCQDFKFACNAQDHTGQNGWVKTENKVLYENKSREAFSFEEEINGQKFTTDRELKMYREGLLGICEGLGIKLIDCSINGILGCYFRAMSIPLATVEFCKVELSPGRTVIPHLARLVRDGKELWKVARCSGEVF